MNTYKLLEPSYINGALLPAGAVVRINDNPTKGGMRPGKYLVPCDEAGEPAKRRVTKSDEKVDDIA